MFKAFQAARETAGYLEKGEGWYKSLYDSIMVSNPPPVVETRPKVEPVQATPLPDNLPADERRKKTISLWLVAGIVAIMLLMLCGGGTALVVYVAVSLAKDGDTKVILKTSTPDPVHTISVAQQFAENPPAATIRPTPFLSSANTPYPSNTTAPTSKPQLTATMPVQTTTYAEGVVEKRDGKTRLSVTNPKSSPLSARLVAYSETGSDTIDYVIDVPDGYNAIVGGYCVGDQCGGCYRGYGPGQHKVTVKDGFAMIVHGDWAKDQWDEKIAIAKKSGWALTLVDPGPIR